MDQLADHRSPPEKPALQLLAETLKEERDDDVKAREQAGFDKLWAKCEDNYAGVDEMNLHESLLRLRYTKPMSADGGLILDDTAQKTLKHRATAFLRMTSRYVDAARAKIREITLPADDKAYKLKPTPMPELAGLKENLEPLTFANGQPMLRDPKLDELAPPNPANPLLPPAPPPGMPSPSQLPGVPLTGKDMAEEKEALAQKKADQAEKQISDWFTEGKFRRQMGRVLFHMAKLGVGILKAPTPEVRISTAVHRQPLPNGKEAITIERLEEVKPGFQVVSPWDFYPDKNCGDDIHAGSHIWERSRLSERKLKALKSLPGYIPEAIDEVIDQGPGKIKLSRPKDQQKQDDRYELWHRIGMISKEQATAFNAAMNTTVQKGDKTIDLSLPTDQDQLFVTVTMVNDTLIRCVKHTLESGKFNYHAIPWQERDDSWVGIGVAEQLFMPQALITATLRSVINNAGNSSGPQIVMRRNLVNPSDGVHEVTPWKIWEMLETAAIDDVRKVFAIVPIPSEVTNLMQLAEFAMRLAEESTNIPLVTQGLSGETTPETLGATQLQNNNANQLLRDVANHIDDYGTEPMVTQFYEHLLLDPDVDDACKGDFQIDAHGSVVMVERYIQNQFLASLAPVVINPAFGLNPKKWMGELMAANHYDPDKLQYTEAEQQKLASVPPPQDPRIETAKIQAEAMLKKAQLDQQGDAADRQAEAQQQFQLEMLRYANERKMSLEEIKAELASTVMKLRVQQQLSLQSAREQQHNRHQDRLEHARDLAAEGYEHERDRAHQQALTPPTEPAGRAENGAAFQQ